MTATVKTNDLAELVANITASNVFVTQSAPPRTRVTVKNPELQYKNKPPTEFKQEAALDWSI
jgi:hypothetical protein